MMMMIVLILRKQHRFVKVIDYNQSFIYFLLVRPSIISVGACTNSISTPAADFGWIKATLYPAN
jgi:glycerol uptake facilitator-like aquaporin